MDESADCETPITSGNSIVCMICLDLMGTGIEDLIALTCGHVFHAKCTDLWTERSHSCPVCRANITAANIVKLFFEVKNVDIPRKIVLMNSIDNMKFDMAIMKKTTDEAKSELAVHKDTIRNLRRELKQKIGSERQLTEMYNMEKERSLVKSSALAEAELKLRKMEKEICENKSYRTIFEGSETDLEEECRKGILTQDQLILCLIAFKKNLRSKSAKLTALRKDYVELCNQHESLKRQLQAQTSKGSDTRNLSSRTAFGSNNDFHDQVVFSPSPDRKSNFSEPSLEAEPGPSTSKVTFQSKRLLGDPLSPSTKWKTNIEKKRSFLGPSSRASKQLSWRDLKAKENTLPVSGLIDSSTPKLKKCKIVTSIRKPLEIVISDDDDNTVEII